MQFRGVILILFEKELNCHQHFSSAHSIASTCFSITLLTFIIKILFRIFNRSLFITIFYSVIRNFGIIRSVIFISVGEGLPQTEFILISIEVLFLAKTNKLAIFTINSHFYCVCSRTICFFVYHFVVINFGEYNAHIQFFRKTRQRVTL